MRLSVLVLSLVSAAVAADIPQGSHVLLRLENSVSTRTAREGDYVYCRTASPIAVNGQILVPEGSYVRGIVTHTVRSGRVKGRAELAIRIDTLTLPGGKVIKLSPRLSSVDSEGTEQKVVSNENAIKQGASHGADAARIAELGGAGAAIGGLAAHSWTGAGIGAGVGGAVGLTTVLLTRGREVDLHRGATMDVVFDRPVTVE